MSYVLPTGGPGDGYWPNAKTLTATNRTGATLVVGDLLMLDLRLSGTEVDNNNLGSTDADGNNSGLNNVVLPATDMLLYGVYVVALGATADNVVGEFQLYGVVNMNVAGATVAGDGLCPGNASDQGVISTGALNAKIVAISREADASNIASVFFNGEVGFGTDAD